MPREYYSVGAILSVGSSALPATRRNLDRHIAQRGWRDDASRARLVPGAGRDGGTWEYHVSLLPSETRALLMAAELEGHAPEAGEGEEAWRRYERLPERVKTEAQRRLACVDQVATLTQTMSRAGAVALVAKQQSISATTLWGWLKRIADVRPGDRLPALAPRHRGRAKTATCDPRAWDFLVADYLRPEQPSFTACHRRMVEAATDKGWHPIPSAKTLQRRLEREVPRGAREIARKGAHAAKAIYPHQTRDRSVFHALEAVNADGHTFDVFVRWEDGSVGRPIMVAVQDLHSGMILAHRIDRTENWTMVRLAFADLIESFGVPAHCWLDNGRGFASKWLTGGTANRYRFKIKDDEPDGILTQLGVQVHWNTPYHGQAKPIERAFRDLCEEVAKHPKCAGAWTGNRPDAKPDNYGSRAIPIEDFRMLVAAEITRHNQRPGRRAATCRGRSFAETFRMSFEASTIRRASEAQRRLFLLAAESVVARKPTGEVQLLGNRYWAEPLVDRVGRKLVMRFDPQDLLRPAAIYSLDGRFICEAPVIEAAGFDDVAAGREHARARRQWLRAQRELLDAERRLSIADVAALMPEPEPEALPEAAVVQLVANSDVRPDTPHTDDTDDGEASFGRGVARLYGEVVRFPRED